MKILTAKAIVFYLLLQFSVCGRVNAQGKVNWKKVSVLVYTKNGKGYVHDNIPAQ